MGCDDLVGPLEVLGALEMDGSKLGFDVGVKLIS